MHADKVSREEALHSELQWAGAAEEMQQVRLCCELLCVVTIGAGAILARKRINFSLSALFDVLFSTGATACLPRRGHI